MEKIRLDKLLRGSGVSSRRETRELIAEKRLTVNGKIADSGAMLCSLEDDICIDGRLIQFTVPLYIMMNKPAGYICAVTSEKEKTVMCLLGEEHKEKRLFPVGRLDKDSEGLLILTNDGDFCRRLIRPEHNIVKQYYIEVNGSFFPDTVERFEKGMVLPNGTKCLPAKIQLCREGNAAYVSITEGKTHQVKRMTSASGARVRYLKRLSIGGLELDSLLKPGEYRIMTQDEVNKIL